MKYKLAEDVMLQKFEGERYVIDLLNEKTYNVNDDAFKILECIHDVFMSVEEICEVLGDGQVSASEIDKEYIEEFTRSIKDKGLLACQ